MGKLLHLLASRYTPINPDSIQYIFTLLLAGDEVAIVPGVLEHGPTYHTITLGIRFHAIPWPIPETPANRQQAASNRISQVHLQ